VSTALVTPAGASDVVRRFFNEHHGVFIGGEWLNAADGATLHVRDPASGEIIAVVPAGGAKDVDAAVQAATAAFAAPSWARLRAVDRERLVHRLADLIEAHIDELAEIECFDSGKSAVLAKRVDVRGAIDYLRYIAGWATKLEGSTIDVSFPKPRGGGDYFAYTRKEPVGVVGAIIPWNFPLLMAVWKIGPALVSGCTIVLKPAEQTPLTALRLGALVHEAGIPPGVVNIVTGYGVAAGAALAAHPGVAKIAFTGSTEVGKLIGKAAMNRMARVSLELGGKSPVIIFDDADLESAAPGAASAIFYNHGQVCCAGSRLYVQRRSFERVVGKIVEIAEGMRMGPGIDPKSQIGPLVSAEHRDRVLGYIEKGAAAGARILAGGAAEGQGYFVKPTVLVDAVQDAAVTREEIFGPVLIAIPFDEPEEALALANDSEFGLAASVWSRDLSTVHRLVPRIRAGTVWVNCHNLIDPALPFGGVKQSGIGREMGKAVLDMYTETKSVCMLV
jgi:phenylacetaldehyde dehydrogenase